MAGQPKRRAREAAEAAAAATRAGETFPPPVRPGAVATTIAQTLPLTSVPATPAIFPSSGAFPGQGGARVRKRPPITAFDPPPVVQVAAPVAPPPPETHAPPDPAEFVPASAAPPPRTLPRPAHVAPPPAAFAAAQANDYAQRMSAREAEHWAKSREVPIAEPLLMHAWAWAVQQYPPSALTVWLTRTVPETGSYQFFVTGEELAGDYYPDRKLYETVRMKRRQPTIAEKFIGRIRGMSAEGKALDVAYGEISFPPEERTVAPAWGPAATAGAPWGSPYASFPGGAPPWGGPGPWGAGPPGYGPYGPPPPWWGAPPWGGPPPSWATPAAAAAAAQPPPHIAADPTLLEIWKMMQEGQAALTRASAETAGRANEEQGKLVRLLLERVIAPPAATAAGAGGGVKETLSMLSDMANFYDKVKGSAGSGSGGGITIHRVDDDLIVENKDGEIDPVATIGLGVKGGFKEIVKHMAQGRAARAGGASPAQAAAGTPTLGQGAGLGGGARVNKAAPPAAGTNGAGG
jgi:hypothetical protein